jgi:hypothetical protein
MEKQKIKTYAYFTSYSLLPDYCWAGCSLAAAVMITIKTRHEHAEQLEAT